MRYNLIILAISTLWLAGCQASSIETKKQLSPEIKPANLKPTSEATNEASRVAKSPRRCGMSPPILNREKITAMLIKSGTIDPKATPQEQALQVQQFIKNKRQAFSKKCRR